VFCLSHDPAMSERLAVSRQLGGVRRRRRPPPPPDAVSLRTVDDAFAMLESAGMDVERLDNGANKVRLKVSIAEAAARMIETSELAKRLEALEGELADETTRRDSWPA
jgi:hypothetical protein